MEIAILNTKYLTCSPLNSFSLFWVQLNNSQEDFKNLMEDLARRMTKSISTFPSLRCSLRRNGCYSRGTKISYIEVSQTQGNGTVSIDLRDWGHLVERCYSEIYILEDKFRKLSLVYQHTRAFSAKKHVASSSKGINHKKSTDF